ncbi:MAG TPA: class I SAM-dependent methyltransferase [Candidatus Acidoferrales bacterium]|nr:class I SAM-dependent methyltransferase [Candidatus Acidoferrales bacterium]
MADVERYVNDVITRQTDLQRRMYRETERAPRGRMQTGPDQAALLGFLVKLTGARRAIEVGVFRGHGSLAIASALPDDGKLVACDISEEYTEHAKPYWAEAGVADKIDLRIAPAAQTLGALLKSDGEGSFDFAFIDADKPNYDAYYERCLRLMRTGGLMVFDNVLWGGDVADGRIHDEDTDALRALNLKIRDDQRVDAVLVTIGDGFMLARKR